MKAVRTAIEVPACHCCWMLDGLFELQKHRSKSTYFSMSSVLPTATIREQPSIASKSSNADTTPVRSARAP